MTDEEKRRRALAAGHAAVEAATELLRYAREGENWPAPFGQEVEPIEKLLDAAKMAIEVAAYPTSERSEAEDDAQPEPIVNFGERLQVYSAICNHIEGWA